MPSDRLDKILSGSGKFSRTEARRIILSGLVTVDGKVVRSPEIKCFRESVIAVKGEIINSAEYVYIMMNKPAGYVSASRDKRWPAVFDLLPHDLQKRNVFCAGRLDIDVTGLLLLTDDGSYAHRVMSPGHETPKVYEVHLDEPVGEKEIQMLASGVVLSSGTVYRPAVLEPLAEDPCAACITVTEGKFHEVKNLMAVCGRKIISMRRLSIGALVLDEKLESGAFRLLSSEEIDLVFRNNV